MLNERTLCILVTSVVSLIVATPVCLNQNSDSEILCTPGDVDFVLKNGLVSDHEDVTYITLRSCRITSMEKDAFQKLPSLYYLDLSQNKIKTLTPGLLEGSSGLTYLNISLNEITTFPLGFFDAMPNLELLDAKSNRLVNIVVGSLYPMTKLKHLDISSNDYLGRHLYPDIFAKSANLVFLDFSRTDMTETREELLIGLQVLDFLNLDRCYLQEVPSFAVQPNLSTMKRLFLSSNRIISLTDRTTFQYLDDLEELNLENNPINYIVSGVFAPLKKLKRVILVKNRLTQIPENLFRNLPNLYDVDLSHNAIEQLPAAAFRGSPVSELVVSHNMISYLSENFCGELNEAGASLATFKFDENPWQCACLRDVIEELKKYNIEYNLDKYNGQHPICVTTTDFRCKRQHGDTYKNYISLYYNNIS